MCGVEATTPAGVGVATARFDALALAVGFAVGFAVARGVATGVADGGGVGCADGTLAGLGVVARLGLESVFGLEFAPAPAAAPPVAVTDAAGGTTTYAYSDRSELTRKSLPGALVLTIFVLGVNLVVRFFARRGSQ